MRPDGIVVPSQSFDHDLCFFQRVADLTIEQLITKLAVEALAVAIFPGAAWLYVGGLGAHGCNPLPERQGNELRVVVRTDVGQDVPFDEEIAQRLDDLGGLQTSGHTDALNTLPVHHPPRCAQKRRDPAVSVAAILAGRLDDAGCQSHVIAGRCRHPAASAR